MKVKKTVYDDYKKITGKDVVDEEGIFLYQQYYNAPQYVKAAPNQSKVTYSLDKIFSSLKELKSTTDQIITSTPQQGTLPKAVSKVGAWADLALKAYDFKKGVFKDVDNGMSPEQAVVSRGYAIVVTGIAGYFMGQTLGKASLSVEVGIARNDVIADLLNDIYEENRKVANEYFENGEDYVKSLWILGEHYAEESMSNLSDNSYTLPRWDNSYYLNKNNNQYHAMQDNRVVYGHRDPLAIDLDGDGLETVSKEGSTAYFDLDKNGMAEKTGWISGDDGILARDVYGDGVVNDGSELFGDKTMLGGGCGVAASGFQALSELDSNKDRSSLAHYKMYSYTQASGIDKAA